MEHPLERSINDTHVNSPATSGLIEEYDTDSHPSTKEEPKIDMVDAAFIAMGGFGKL